MDTQKLLDEACPIINEVGWAFYFTPDTIARGGGFGLDPFEFYFLGRGGVLGDVDASVVHSAFGYFNPAGLAAMWNAGREKLDPRAAAREFLAAAHDFGREKLTGIPELGGFIEAAAQVVAAARLHPEGLTLFAGVSAEPVPTDAPAAAMHYLVVLREFRGSAHLLAIVAGQLDTKTAHFLRRPEMFTTFGWTDDDAPRVGDAEAAALRAADTLTDALVSPAYAVLDDDGAAKLLSGLAAIGPAISGAAIPAT